MNLANCQVTKNMAICHVVQFQSFSGKELTILKIHSGIAAEQFQNCNNFQQELL